jgi:CubicO group peptidase (beta-lactamase class C family)
VGLAAELLRLEGRIDLDAPISRYVPDLRLAPPLDPRGITLRQLLTHTHGIENWGPVVFRTAMSGEGDRRQLLALLATHGPAQAGATFQYGNIGYNAAGLIIRSATGRTWQDWLQRLVLRPLGLNVTTPYASAAARADMAHPYMFNGQGYTLLRQAKADTTMHAAGGMFSSLRDMKRWVRVTMGNGRVDGRAVVPAAAIEATGQEWARRLQPMPGAFPMQGYGLGWDQGSYRGERILMSQGGFSAYQSIVTYMPGKDLGIVVLTNEAGSGEDLVRAVSQYVFDVALGGEEARQQWAQRMQQLPRMVQRSRDRIAGDIARRLARPPASPTQLATYVGTYRHPDWGTIKVQERGGRLHVRAGAAESQAEPFNLAEHQWRIEFQPARGETIQFSLVGPVAQTVTFAGVTFARTR